MKTADEIKDALHRCSKSWGDCDECPYHKDGCSSAAMADALKRIKELEGIARALAEKHRKEMHEGGTSI